MIRMIEGKLYAPVQSKVSHAQNKYAVFALRESKSNKLYRFRCFKQTAELAVKQLSSGVGELELVVEADLDAEQNDEVLSGVCKNYSFASDKEAAKHKKSVVTARDKDEFKESLAKMFERGIVWARDLKGIRDWCKKEGAVRAYKQWWVKIDFSILMLGADKVTELMAGEFGGVGRMKNVSKWKEFNEQIFGLAYADYKAGIKPREIARRKALRETDSDGLLQVDSDQADERSEVF